MATGIAGSIVARAARGAPVLGVCGGCQILGQGIADPDRVESDEGGAFGLGLLPVTTRFGREKRTAQLSFRIASRTFLGEPSDDGVLFAGYEIHSGRVTSADPARAP